MPRRVDTYRAEFLAMTAGREHDGNVLILTMRPDARTFEPYNFSFTPAQAARIHEELGRLIYDPKSWLHVPEEQQQKSEEL
jgi:hypothetical protein